MRIPEHFAQQQMETSRLPRAPAWYLSRTGAGLEAEAIAQAGGAMGKVADMLADIQAERQRGRDNATLAKLSDQERDFVYGAYGTLEEYVAAEIKDFGKLEKDFATDWDKEIKKLLKDQNRQVKEHFTLWSKQNRAKILQDYHSRVWPKEQSFAQGQAISIADKQLRRGDLKGALQTYKQHAQYFPPKTLQALKDQAEGMAVEYQKQAFLDTVHEAAKTMPYKEAISYLNDLKGIAKEERNDLIARRKRQEDIETVVTDEVAKAELESRAYDIWTGAESIENFKEDLDKALGVSIDKNAYSEIISLAQREHKTYQATAIKTAIDEAKMQLIDLPSDMSLADTIRSLRAERKGLKQKEEIERILSERQLQFWHHGQYRRALNQWFADNPEATADEIYIESKKLLSHYRKREISEIKELLSEREARLFTVSPDVEEMKKKYPEIWEAAGRAIGEVDISDIPEPKTQTEFVNQIRTIKGKGKARAYYDKWVDKFW